MSASTPIAPPTAGPLVRLPVALFLAVLSGCLVFTSFPFSTEPDTNIWIFGWFALVPYFVILEGRRPRSAFWLGFLAGFVTNFGGFWWISEVLGNFGHLPPYISWPLTALNAAYQGLVFAIAAAIIARLTRERGFCVWRVAAIFTVVEWLFPMLFPWFLGNGQYRFLPAIQIAEIGGVPAVTFAMVVANGLLFRLLRWRQGGPSLSRRAIIAPAAFVLGVLIYGAVRVGMVNAEAEAAPSFKLGLVEADIGIFEKQAEHLDPQQRRFTLHRNLLKHQRMSQELAAAGAEVIVWPESSYIPFIEPWIKQTDDFLLGLSDNGAIVRGDPRAGAWRPAPVEGGLGLRGLASAREDAWLAYGEGGTLVSPLTRRALPDEPDLRGATFVSA